MSRSEHIPFLTWYRAIPMAAMAVMLVVALVSTHLPLALGRIIFCPVDHVAAIRESSERHGVDPYLTCAIIKCESGWDANATSEAGAVGLMQLLPATAEELVSFGYVDGSAYSPQNLTDPATNIEFGCAYLQFLQANLDSEDEVIAAYNAGIGTVHTWSSYGYESFEEAIQYPETAAYLVRVRVVKGQYQDCYPDGIA